MEKEFINILTDENLGAMIKQLRQADIKAGYERAIKVGVIERKLLDNKIAVESN